jgi:uncharacterized repeat protein (TIGR03803 family)
MKIMKLQYLSVIPDQKMAITIRSAHFLAQSFRIFFIAAALVLCLPLNILNAQYLHIDHTGKNSYPENKNLSFETYGFTKLLDFYGPESGKWPEEIIISDNWLYGLNYSGGEYDYGLIFKIKTDGSGLTRFVFDGAKPNALVLSGSVLYGATRSAGTYDGGVLYRINTDGSGLAILYNFQKEFTNPVYSLIISGSIIYGQVFESMEGSGFIFKINTDGTGFVKLADISKFPYADLLLYDNYLYGITMGGTSAGEIFKLKNDGTGFLALHSFTNPQDGQKSYNPLTVVGNSLYGTTESGGINNKGTLFKIDTDGTKFEKLYDFSSTGGFFVRSQLVLSGSYLYGTAMMGGNSGLGTIFRFNKDGSGFEKLYDFQEEVDGSRPEKFVMSGDTIFGYTSEGGLNNDGILYRFTVKESTDTLSKHPKVVKLAIKRPEQVTITTKSNLEVKNDQFINLDTTFSVTGDIQYTHIWKVKTNSGYDIIDKTAQITSDSTFYLFLTTVQGCSYSDSVTVQVKSSTAIFDPDISQLIGIYPNPNTGDFRIIISGGNGKYSYEIIDITGTKTADGIIDCTSGECIFDISLSDAKPGTYTMVIVRNGAFLGRTRFIISR